MTQTEQHEREDAVDEAELEREDPVADPALEREEAHVAAEEPADDDVHAQAEEQPQPEAPLGDLDEEAEAASPELDVAESLRNALGSMREEADRIAALGTGEEQVQAAERFAEGAGTLDEQIGSAARAADEDPGR